MSLSTFLSVILLAVLTTHLYYTDSVNLVSALHSLKPWTPLLYAPYLVNHFRYKATLPNRKIEWRTPPEPSARDKQRPNVILLLADDLGFNDISFHGGGFHKGLVETPNIDSIAQNGVSFKNAYSGKGFILRIDISSSIVNVTGHATCAPSRASLITGKYPTRIGYEFTPATQMGSFVLGRLMGNNALTGIYRSENRQLGSGNYAIPEDELMLSSALKEGGYNNIYLGKWHNGNDNKLKSMHRGFDEFLGFSLFAKFFDEKNPRAEHCYLNDLFDDFLRANLRYHVEYNGGDYFEPDGYMTDYLAKEAVRAIEANRNNPFFMYMSFTAVHSPLTALKADYDRLSRIEDHCDRVYAAMIVALDRAVGQILQAIKSNGLADNTLVIFTSDNGAPNFINRKDVNLPYRGWKASFFEGGVHVPMFMQWPRRIPAGISRDAVVAHVDLFPSILAAAGVALNQSSIDGLDILPLITTDTSQPLEGATFSTDSLHETLFWRSDHYLALRKNNWKLHVVSVPLPKIWLYNLLEDRSESHNLADSQEHADVLNGLLETLYRINATQIEPLWPTLSCTPILIDKLFADSYIVGDTYVYWPN